MSSAYTVQTVTPLASSDDATSSSVTVGATTNQLLARRRDFLLLMTPRRTPITTRQLRQLSANSPRRATSSDRRDGLFGTLDQS